MTFEELDKSFEKLLADIPKSKRRLVEISGDKMYEKVMRNIDFAVKIGTGNLKSGVTKIIGSEGGYSAIKPDWKKAPHTHLVENGHRSMVGKGESQRFVGWVPGKHMYRNAITELADELENDAEQLLAKLVGDAFD